MSNCRSRNPCRVASAAIMRSVRYQHTGSMVSLKSTPGCWWLPPETSHALYRPSRDRAPSGCAALPCRPAAQTRYLPTHRDQGRTAPQHHWPDSTAASPLNAWPVKPSAASAARVPSLPHTLVPLQLAPTAARVTPRPRPPHGATLSLQMWDSTPTRKCIGKGGHHWRSHWWCRCLLHHACNLRCRTPRLTAPAAFSQPPLTVWPLPLQP